MCGQCHSPRDSAGVPDRSRWLQGAPVWLVSAQPMAEWPLQAPRIAGTPPGNDAALVTLLTTGIWRDGKPLRPPMPQFHMTREDAASVVAYLKSLGAGATVVPIRGQDFVSNDVQRRKIALLAAGIKRPQTICALQRMRGNHKIP